MTAAVTAHVGVTPAQVVTLSPGGLPRTSSGKLRRAETRRRYLAGDLTGPDLTGTGDHPATPAPPASLVDRSTR
ncbi:hypothetical protein [Micromonospora rifamycinica]|uniref:hypothetical protein n=1 Tax=Micromonospora rifamycinica TaxID=291594 RepID=UPI00076D3541|nr:hypothetical protein [Micromonospora rifamycinica]KWV29631.1 hypothetical protein AWV63_27460 [Micromonospora rifamycinica]